MRGCWPRSLISTPLAARRFAGQSRWHEPKSPRADPKQESGQHISTAGAFAPERGAGEAVDARKLGDVDRPAGLVGLGVLWVTGHLRPGPQWRAEAAPRGNPTTPWGGGWRNPPFPRA